MDVDQLETHTTAFERVNEITPIADLHWNLSHVQEIDQGILERLKAIGAGRSPSRTTTITAALPWATSVRPTGSSWTAART